MITLLSLSLIPNQHCSYYWLSFSSKLSLFFDLRASLWSESQSCDQCHMNLWQRKKSICVCTVHIIVFSASLWTTFAHLQSCKCAIFIALYSVCECHMCVSDVLHPPACSCADMCPNEREREREREMVTWKRSHGLTMCCCLRPGELVLHNNPLTVCVCVCQCYIALIRTASCLQDWSLCCLLDRKDWET